MNPEPRDARYTAPWERTFDRLISPIEEFIHYKSSSGILLFVCAALSFALANSPLAEGFTRLLHTPLTVGAGGFALTMTAHHWVNDGLMAIFFLLMGLEIKRELLAGELSQPRKAALPVMAAMGGMLVPALIYLAFNTGLESARGWGVPMATDIAFAVGALALLGARAPKNLFVFLISLAIADDIGAVIVIAMFYTAALNMAALQLAILLALLLLALNRAGVRRLLPYFMVGGALWYAIGQSGAHATIAGIILAAAIPVRPQFEPARFSRKVRGLVDNFDAARHDDTTVLLTGEQHVIINTLAEGVRKVQPPLSRLEHSLHMPVEYFIMPLFALLNAGAPVTMAELGAAFTDPVTLGVAFGLVVGKFAGIVGFTLIPVALGLAALPSDITRRHVIGVGLLGGIGFTMSIFIAELAFASEDQIRMAKIGILAGSLIAGAAGYLVLKGGGAVEEGASR
ncbi:MAG: Na+/H+ antiporter NhaA [Nitrospinae bacterium]|nr:Na+/H+ antiporter NhaA [Nitrospinota bacterium]